MLYFRAMTPHTILFDCFGTLTIPPADDPSWDHWYARIEAILLNEFGFSDPAGLSFLCADFFTADVGGYEDTKNDNTLYEMRMARLLGELKLPSDPRVISRLAEESVAAWGDSQRFDHEVIAILNHFQGRKLGMVSNFDHAPYIHGVLQSNKVADYFDVIVISGEVGIQKPDAGIFHLALEQLGSRAAGSIFIGDSVKYDMAGALAAGLTPILIDRKSDSVKPDEFSTLLSELPADRRPPLRVIHNLAELRDLID